MSQEHESEQIVHTNLDTTKTLNILANYLFSASVPLMCVCKLIPILNYVTTEVPFRDLQHFTHKASMTSVNAEASAHSTDWLMSIFVNELTPPHVRSHRGGTIEGQGGQKPP